MKHFQFKNSEIVILPEFVVKNVKAEILPYYNSNMREYIKILAKIYNKAKGSQGLIQICDPLKLLKTNIYRVTLSTRGRPAIIPTNEISLQKLTKDLLLGLSHLHASRLVHRNIC